MADIPKETLYYSNINNPSKPNWKPQCNHDYSKIIISPQIQYAKIRIDAPLIDYTMKVINNENKSEYYIQEIIAPYRNVPTLIRFFDSNSQPKYVEVRFYSKDCIYDHNSCTHYKHATIANTSEQLVYFEDHKYNTPSWYD